MYEPDRSATADALEGAAHIVAKHGSLLTVPERACAAASTSDNPPFGGRPHNLRALNEMVELTKRTGLKMQYSQINSPACSSQQPKTPVAHLNSHRRFSI